MTRLRCTKSSLLKDCALVRGLETLSCKTRPCMARPNYCDCLSKIECISLQSQHSCNAKNRGGCMTLDDLPLVPLYLGSSPPHRYKYSTHTTTKDLHVVLPLDCASNRPFSCKATWRASAHVPLQMASLLVHVYHIFHKRLSRPALPKPLNDRSC
jgi:hypothetical protein